jgi:hypothetical protein
MNTTDIRDTDRTQIVFWATALPVTALVVFLSLAYGYKSNAIEDTVSRAWQSMARTTRQTKTSSEKVPVGLANRPSFNDVTLVKLSRLPDWMHYKRRRKGKGNVERRVTDDSFFA